jgi:hypothetical protein
MADTEVKPEDDVMAAEEDGDEEARHPEAMAEQYINFTRRLRSDR